MENNQQLWRQIRASYSIVQQLKVVRLISLTWNRIISLPIRMNKEQCRFSRSRQCNTTSSMGWAKISNSKCLRSSFSNNSRCSSNSSFNTPITKITPLSIQRIQCLMWLSTEVILECPKISARTVQNQQQARIHKMINFTIIKGLKLLISLHRIIGSNRTTQSIRSKRRLPPIWHNRSRVSHITR